MSAAIGIVGGGGFGRGLAHAAARHGRRVVLYSRVLKEFDARNVAVVHDFASFADAEVVFLAVPSRFVAEVADSLAVHLDGRHYVVHVSRGLVGASLTPLSRTLLERTAVRRVGVLAGPLVVDSLERGTPGGAIVGTPFPEVADAVRRALAGPTLRVYETDDIVGAELASAFSGVLALAAGYAHGTGLGPGTLAVLVTRGLAELTRIGVKLGAQAKTFQGLAGVGDLLAAVADDGRPELALGRAIAIGTPLERALGELDVHVEAVELSRRVADFARSMRMDAPITSTIAALVDGSMTREAAIAHLMSRSVLVE